jgi:phospholipase/carboxylesterase
MNDAGGRGREATERGIESHTHVWEPPTAELGTTLLLLHGTGGDERDLVPLGRALLPGAGLLGVRGNVSEHGAPRFFRRLAEGVFDIEDLHRRTADLAEFVESAAARYGFDRRRVIAVGFSNGANVAASLLLSHPSVLAGGVLFRAMVPFEPEVPVRLEGRSVLLGEGRFDPLVSVEQAERLKQIFQDAGADTTLEWQDAGHQLTQNDVSAAQRWIATRG